MSLFLELVISGIALGAVYGLVALGFVLIFKSTGIFNLAQGQLVLIGAFMAFAFSVQAGLPFWLAAGFALVFSFLLGLLIERILLRPMIGQPVLSLVMMTIGLSITLRALVLFIWGPLPYSYPPYLPQEGLHIGPAIVPESYVFGLIVSVILLLCLFVFFRYSKLGLAMRATADDQQVAQSLGIPVSRIFGIGWAISSLTACVGGIVLGTLLSVTVLLGEVGLRSLPAAILGGLESLPGVVIGGLLLGIIENLSGGYLDSYIPGIKDVVPYVVMLIILMIRPYGLLGQKKIERV